MRSQEIAFDADIGECFAPSRSFSCAVAAIRSGRRDDSNRPSSLFLLCSCRNLGCTYMITTETIHSSARAVAASWSSRRDDYNRHNSLWQVTRSSIMSIDTIVSIDTIDYRPTCHTRGDGAGRGVLVVYMNMVI